MQVTRAAWTAQNAPGATISVQPAPDPLAHKAAILPVRDGSGLAGDLLAPAPGRHSYQRPAKRMSGTPGMPVGLHEETTRITSVF